MNLYFLLATSRPSSCDHFTIIDYADRSERTRPAQALRCGSALDQRGRGRGPPHACPEQAEIVHGQQARFIGRTVHELLVVQLLRAPAGLADGVRLVVLQLLAGEVQQLPREVAAQEPWAVAGADAIRRRRAQGCLDLCLLRDSTSGYI